MDNIEKLKTIVLEKTFKYREEPSFKLSSGQKSHFYFDCKKTTLDPQGSYLIGEILYEMSKEFSIKGGGGLTLGADPMASALMYSAWSHGKEINQFIVRKKLKKHGAVKWIEGNMRSGDNVIVLDDVVTTGGSVVQAIEKIKEDGLNVVGVIVLVDREEFNGIEKIREAVPGKPVKAIISRSEIMEKYNNTPQKIDEDSDRSVAYA